MKKRLTIEELTRFSESKGGMCVVYRYFDKKFGRDIAIKAPQHWMMTDPTLVERFKLEARLLSRINHTNVVHLYPMGDDEDEEEESLPDGRPYYRMEWLEGETLDARIKRDPTLGPKGGRLLLQLAHALTAVHAHGIVHRDVKPNNVMVVQESGGSECAKLFDFGIAKGEVSLTRADQAIGTPEYMPPEQARGEPVTDKSDVFSFGIVLYKILTGTCPYPSGYQHRCQLTRNADTLLWIHRMNPAVSAELAQLVARMIEPEAALRPTMREVVRVLEPLGNGPVPLPRPQRAPSDTPPTLRQLGSPSSSNKTSLAPAVVSATPRRTWRLPIWLTLLALLTLLTLLALLLGGAGMAFWTHPGVRTELPTPPNMARITMPDGGPLAVDLTEVTIADYERCVAARQCSPARCPCDGAGSGSDCQTPASSAQHPVVCVSVEQAAGYCEHTGKRLPTSDEWVVAAYGGELRLFPWGNDGWQNKVCPGPETCPVGSHHEGRTPAGLLDMAGNVWEWTQSVCHENLYRIRGGSVRTFTGPALSKDGTSCEDSKRGHLYVGFRCVLPLRNEKRAF